MQSALRELLSQAIARNPRSIIGIDGPAGSGKSTLASEISGDLTHQGLTVHCLHMDDLYDGWENPFSANLYERLSAIVQEHRRGGDLHYSAYDWAEKCFAPPITYPSTQILIVEGVGSCGQEIRSNLDLSIWIEVNSGLGLQRVLEREPYLSQTLMENWQKIESTHFHLDETERAVDITLSTNPD
jgi:uridine kinase